MNSKMLYLITLVIFIVTQILVIFLFLKSYIDSSSKLVTRAFFNVFKEIPSIILAVISGMYKKFNGED